MVAKEGTCSISSSCSSSPCPPQTKKESSPATRRPLLFSSLFGTKINRPSASKPVVEVLGGRYLSKKIHASTSDGSLDTTENATESSLASNWLSCRSQEEYQQQQHQLSNEDQLRQWGQAIVDARRLPTTSVYANNVIMVNSERTKRTIPAVKRCAKLDEVARWHAQVMARECNVRHSDAKELQAKLVEQQAATTSQHLGENVGCGTTIRDIHCAMMENTTGDARNITDRRYTEMGMATARCPSTGELYLCQIFRG